MKSVIALLMLCAGCGGRAPGGFAGTYAATLSAVAHFTSPPIPDRPYSDSGTITIVTNGASDMMASFLSDAGQSYCVVDFTRNGNSAMAVGGQTWSGSLTNGAQQTNSNLTSTATINGDALTITFRTDISGVNAQGVSYAGWGSGTWSGTRR
jgi:hypothetical protein